MIGSKLIILLDNGEPIPPIVGQMGKENVWYLDTEIVDSQKEYDFINSSIDRFGKTSRSILLIKFSGDEDVARRIGDEREEMVLHLSPAEDNEYYITEYIKTLKEFINIFYEETNIC